MKSFTGKTVFDGVAVGKIVFYGKKKKSSREKELMILRPRLRDLKKL